MDKYKQQMQLVLFFTRYFFTGHLPSPWPSGAVQHEGEERRGSHPHHVGMTADGAVAQVGNGSADGARGWGQLAVDDGPTRW
jgi:hypothetical protein